MKATLLKCFTNSAANHTAMAKCCKALSGHFAGAVEKTKKSDMENGADISDVCEEIADMLEQMADAHADEAENCIEVAKACSATGKAMGVADEDSRMMPSDVSIVAPDAPITKNKLVTRFGQRIPTAADVPPEFRKLISIEDGSEESETA